MRYNYWKESELRKSLIQIGAIGPVLLVGADGFRRASFDRDVENNIDISGEPVVEEKE